MTHIPAGWKLLEKKTCFMLMHDGAVIATLAGPDSKENAAIIASMLVAAPRSHSAEQDAALGDIGQPSSALLCAARAVVAADDAQALTSQLINVLRAACDAAAVGDAREAHFDLWQDDMVVASASGPRAQALQEIQHYAAVYSQDGPVQIEEVIRIPLNAAQQDEGSNHG